MKDTESDKISNIHNNILENLRNQNPYNQDANWKFDKNAFYTSGVDSDENIEQRFNVYDAPIGYKWVTYKNPNYDYAKLKDKQFMALFSPYGSEITEEDRYPYLWHRQLIDSGNASGNIIDQVINTAQNINNNIPNEPLPQTSGNNNNAMTLYGAPQPMAGALPPNLQQTSQLSQPNMPNTMDIPKMQGNSKIGTTGESSRIPTGSFKQTALYNLFGKSQENNASTSKFIF